MFCHQLLPTRLVVEAVVVVEAVLARTVFVCVSVYPQLNLVADDLWALSLLREDIL